MNDCPVCCGAGLLTSGHPHDPNAHVWRCEKCDGKGKIPADWHTSDCECDACVVGMAEAYDA